MAGYYESVKLNFMIAGHTKFKCDGNFGMIKKLYRKSTIYCKEDFVEVVKKSSPKGLNKVQCYDEGKEFQYFDFKVLEKFFTKLPKINRYHHFYFSSNDPGVVRVQEFANEPFREFNLLQTNGRVIAEIIKEIRNLVFSILTSKPLKLER
jgi:hypothetical protein